MRRPPGRSLRMSCRAAMPTGAQAAQTGARPSRGAEPGGAEPGVRRSQRISLAARLGPFSSPIADDRPRSLYLGGRTAASSRRRSATTPWRRHAKPPNPARTPGSERLAAGSTGGAQCDSDSAMTPDEHAGRFTHCALAFTIAYEILGSATESGRCAAGQLSALGRRRAVEGPGHKTYLARLVTRQAQRACATARRRETYVGPWLPGPFAARRIRIRPTTWCWPIRFRWRCRRCSDAGGPDERAVFVLREVFGFDYDEIAAA